MSYYEWRPYVPVAERRRQAERKLAKLAKTGQVISPVKIEGRVIAASVWGKAWCTNLERYSDYASRLPRGRSYVRNGSVVDLQIATGEVSARVAGSELYAVTIAIVPVSNARWKAMCRDCAGSVDSLIELLQGRLAKGVMDRVCREGDGLFPAPKEIKLRCSCPDWADMCKHVAATLYGVGARLDAHPELLFALRGVDQKDLIARAGEGLPSAKAAPAATKVLAEDDVAALFGLDMAGSDDSPVVVAAPRRAAKAGSAPAAKRKAATKSGKPAPAAGTRAGRKAKTAAAGKRRRS
jgi:uncharacterized Zn finger protein